eukprot:CAMPEP_0194365442 /NCGR_PEP_ID=MMETSP0174-20130528/13499_1 /TAXON_ID=216777 /ORGANISM="Proboscia alata, Strain PI-D3" /LENGTH=307 /DNA_ID=CAMNT_0039140145 /DNA_START=283 /DNA_END=1206 /DNA_ORIENTATION=+
MTAISTFFSVAMLPLNLYIYTSLAYDEEDGIIEHLDWTALFVSLTVVMLAIGGGVFCSAKFDSPKFSKYANLGGNVAGIVLVLFSILSASGYFDSSTEDSETDTKDNRQGLWDRDAIFYVGVAAPCVLGLIAATLITTYVIKLELPERTSVAVECCYQNTGIATSVAISMFDGRDRDEALGVPVFYGIVEAFIIIIFLVGAWKKGWTKAPRDEFLFVVLFTSFEIDEEKLDAGDDTEQIDDGTKIEEVELPPPEWISGHVESNNQNKANSPKVRVFGLEGDAKNHKKRDRKPIERGESTGSTKAELV